MEVLRLRCEEFVKDSLPKAIKRGEANIRTLTIGSSRVFCPLRCNKTIQLSSRWDAYQTKDEKTRNINLQSGKNCRRS